MGRPLRAACRIDNFFKSDNNTLQQVLVEGKKCIELELVLQAKQHFARARVYDSMVC